MNIVLALLCSAAFAATPAKPAVLPGQDVELKTVDGWTIHGRYLPAGGAPQTLILLHGKGERKEVWIRLAKALEKAGYGYFGLDLRGHGESQTGPDGQPFPWRTFKFTKTENDFEGMAHDVEAAVAWLGTQGVAEENVGIIGTDVGGSVGLKYAAVHPKAPVVVLLSPGTHYEEVLTVTAIRTYKNRPILMIYSDADHSSSKDTPVMYAFAKMTVGEKNATVVSIEKLPGIRLPQSSAVIGQIVAWLQNPVKPEQPAGSTGAPAGQPIAPGSVEDDLSPDAPAPSTQGQAAPEPAPAPAQDQLQ